MLKKEKLSTMQFRILAFAYFVIYNENDKKRSSLKWHTQISWNWYILKIQTEICRNENKHEPSHEYVDLFNQLNLGRGRVGKVRL